MLIIIPNKKIYRVIYKIEEIFDIETVRRTLGEDFKTMIFKFDKLRVKRNKFEYQTIYIFQKLS